MTLVKWNNGGNTNGNNQSLMYPANRPLINSHLGSFIPGLWDTFLKPFHSSDFIQNFFEESMNLGTGIVGTTLPAVNISESDADLIIEMAAPGLNKKDFKVDLTDNQLRIAYNKEAKADQDSAKQWRLEYSFESFERIFTLPALVDRDKISANYNDGILSISIPKKEEARKKSAAIEIK